MGLSPRSGSGSDYESGLAVSFTGRVLISVDCLLFLVWFFCVYVCLRVFWPLLLFCLCCISQFSHPFPLQFAIHCLELHSCMLIHAAFLTVEHDFLNMQISIFASIFQTGLIRIEDSQICQIKFNCF